MRDLLHLPLFVALIPLVWLNNALDAVIRFVFRVRRGPGEVDDAG